MGRPGPDRRAAPGRRPAPGPRVWRLRGAAAVLATAPLLVLAGPLAAPAAAAAGSAPAALPAALPAETPTPPPPSPDPTPTDTASGAPTPTDSAAPSPSAEPSASPSPSAVASPSASPVRPAQPPAVRDSGISWVSVLLAVAALLAAGIALRWWLPGGERTTAAAAAEPPTPPAPAGPAPSSTPEGLTPLLIALGEALVDSGLAVAAAQAQLHRIARAHGVTHAEIVVLPTALFITVPGTAPVETAVAAAGVSQLRLDQIDAFSQLADRAALGDTAPTRLLAEVDRIRAAPPPFGPVARTAGYAAFCAGLAMVLRGSALDTAVAVLLGTAVGALQLYAPRLTTTSKAVLPVLSAFGVATAVFLLAGTDLNLGILAPLVAPLVTFLPGALLTTAAIELSTGQMISGAARLATGSMQLLLLALGIVAAAQLVGIPATEVVSVAPNPLGDLAPWIGVALFGVGVVVHHCARPASLGWILLVLYVAYGGQVIGGLFLGGTLSAFVGALAMAPVAAYVATQRGGPPTQVSFLPAFWLLVPGALGLVGVTQLIGADSATAFNSLTTTVATMIAIGLGVLIGLAAGEGAAARAGRRRAG